MNQKASALQNSIHLTSWLNPGPQTALKIGGAEAKSDLTVAFEQLTDYVIAPMIETEYAAHKCVSLFRELQDGSSLNSPSLLINIETTTAFQT